jgi:hypothetical protein
VTLFSDGAADVHRLSTVIGVSLSPALIPYGGPMANDTFLSVSPSTRVDAGYHVHLTDESAELVPDAVGYVQEGPLTTFFSVDHGRGPRFDSWSTKLLSVRTDRIVSIRRLHEAA